MKPSDWKGLSIFMAGGITGTQDWQKQAVDLFADFEKETGKELLLLNPRRKNFPIGDPNAALGQIEWEYRKLRWANEILFWFPCETICPIVLFELGAWSMTQKHIYVGVDPDYERQRDVAMQLSLVRPGVRVVNSLTDLTKQVFYHHKLFGD
jgi:hypothetical protein